MTAKKWKGEFLVSKTSSDEPSVAALADGGFVIVWDGGGLIHGQRYGADGVKVGAEFVLPEAGLATHEQPSVTALPDGGFAVGYVRVLSGTDQDPYVQRYDAAGTPVGGTQSLDGDVDLANQISLSTLNNGNFVGVYRDPDLNGGDIEFEIRSTTGVLVNQGVANVTTANNQTYGDVAGLTSGRFVVVWNNNDNTDLRLRVFQNDGTPVNGADVILNTTPVAGTFFDNVPRVTALDNGGFAVIFHTAFSGFPDTSGESIRARIFDSNGNALGNDFLVNSSTFGSQAWPEIVATPGGGFAAFWFDLGSFTSVRGQLFDNLGNRTGSEFTVSSSEQNVASTYGLSAAELGDHRIVVSWRDGGGRIESQIIDPRDGSVNGGVFGEALYGNDTLGDDISGFGGNDKLFGLAGNDKLFGGVGLDTLVGGLGDDFVEGGASDDRLTGGRETTASWGFMRATDFLADFNGDGRTDIMELSKTGRADVFLSSGTSIRDSTLWQSGVSQSVKFGDFNGDGKMDLLESPNVGGGNARVALSTGSGFGPFTGWVAGASPIDQVADVNADGRADLVQLGANGSMYVALSNGVNAFGAFTLWGTGSRPSDRVADVNGDNRADVVELHENGTAYVWLSTGASFSNFTVWGSGFRPSDQLADFNADGRDDVIQLHENGNAYVWLSNGTSFGNFSVWASGIRPTDKIGDFNGDGRSDIIQLHENGNMYVWLSTGTSFSNFSVWGIGSRPEDRLGDFNGDGRTDVIELHQNGNGYVWLSTGASFTQFQVWGKGTIVGDSAGSDTFSFLGSYGNDIVTDFQAGTGVQDILQLDSATWSGFDDIMAHTADDGFGNTVIAFGGDSITLVGVLKSQLAIDDFQLV